MKIKKLFAFHWKRIAILLLIAQILVWGYLYFHQKEQKLYFTDKVYELKKAHFITEDLEQISQRYLTNLGKQEKTKGFSFTELDNFKDSFPKRLQNLKISWKQSEPAYEYFHDFFVWKRTIQFQTNYKNLIKILDLIAKENWGLSNIVVHNFSKDSKNSLLEMELFFTFIVSKL